MLDATNVALWTQDLDSARDRVAQACIYYAHDLGFSALRERIQDRSLDDEAALRLVADFCNEDVIRAVIETELANFKETPLHVSAFPSLAESFYRGFVLFFHERLMALLVALDAVELASKKRRQPGERRTMTFTGKPSHVKLISGAGLRLGCWAIQPFDDSRDLRNDPPAARRTGEATLRAGETLHLGPFEEVEFLASDGLAVVLLSNAIESAAPVALEVDVDTGALVATTATSQAPTRLQMLASTLRMFDRQDGFEEIRRLLSSEHHFVRWHAMRELLALDGERAAPDLVRLRDSDPQPSVRRAAEATLTQFFPARAA